MPARTLLVALGLLLGCASVEKPAPVAGGRPRLVVLFVVDGFPERQAVDYRDQLSPDGFERFFTRGAWFTNAHYRYATTETCPGHATIVTGAYPHRTGVVANQWFDPATGRNEGCSDDPSAPWIGGGGKGNEGYSPRNLRVESLGDVLLRADSHSKVISISAKPRSAVMTAGKRGTAYILQDGTGQFASTRYYMQSLPRWAVDFNAAKPADAYFGAEWRPLLAEAAYSRSLPDERPWYAPGGKLPKKMAAGGAPNAAFYEEIAATPFADDLELAFARAAIAGESLGRDESPDLLVVCLSSHDLVNHEYGAESRISHDHVLQLDRLLAEFLNDLDTSVGRENYVAVLTADHGFMPAPEQSRLQGRDAGRVPIGPFMAQLQAGLVKKFGEGQWMVRWNEQGVIVNRRLAKAKGVDLDALAHEARALALAQPGVAEAYIRAEVEGRTRAGSGHFDAVALSYDRDRSPDVEIVLKPYWMWGGGSVGTTHGSPYEYDTNVPVLFYGPNWILPGRIDTPVDVSGIAPTLAMLLKVPPPPASEGRVLPLEFRHR